MAVIEGQITLNEIAIAEVDSDPSTGGGLAMPVGSIALLGTQTDGKMWIKTAAGVTAWAIIPRYADGTTFTQGVIPFIDANGNFTANAAKLKFEVSTGRLAIGNNAPATPVSTIHIDRGTGTGGHMRVTLGTTTGQTATDGVEFGADDTGAAEIRQYEALPLNIYTSNTMAFSINSAQRVIIGNLGTSLASATGEESRMQLHGLGTADSQFSMHRYSADILPPNLRFVKSRGATVGAHVAVAVDDIMGTVSFRGSDGSLFGLGASISGYVDAAVAANSIPSRLQFSTTTLAGSTVQERMRIDSSGRVIIGGAAAQDITGIGAYPLFQILGTGAVQMAQIQYSNDTIAPVFNSLKSRGATIGTQGILASNDELGRFQFRGSDGVKFVAGASIRALVDGTPALDSMPGRLIFMTTPTGSVTPVERVRVDSTGLAIFSQGIRIGNETSTVDGNIRYTGTDFEAYQLGGYRSLTGAWISYETVSTANTTTTSTTDVLVTTMTITPVAGTYILQWNMEVSATSNNRVIVGSIYVGGVQVTDSSRQYFVRTGNATFTAADIGRLVGTAKITVNGSQAIEIRWRTNGGTAVTQGRSMSLIEVGQ